jgi:vancomycin resistance protein YoaR
VNDRPYPRRDHDRTVVSLLILGLLVLFGGLYLLGHYLTAGRIPEGTTIGGVNVGGLAPSAAQQRLEQRLGPRASRPIEVVAGGHRARLLPQRAGLTVDTGASVVRAGGGSTWGTAQLWEYFTGGGDLDPVVRVDEPALESAIARVAAAADRPAGNGAVTFAGGRAVPHDPRPGSAVDRERAAALVRVAFLTSTEPVRLPMRRVEPAVSAADVARAMDRFAKPAVAAPVEYTLGRRSVRVRPEAYAGALSMEARGGTLVPAVDEDRLLALLRPRIRTLTRPARDATVALAGGRPRVVPARRGVGFDPDEVTGRFLDLVRRTDRRTQVLEPEVRRPAFTTAEAEALKIRERVSSFTSYFPHAGARDADLARAAALVDGTVLHPGDVFSLNAALADEENVAGEMSEVATALFNAAFLAGLKDIEHTPHSTYVDRYPVGREATVAWPSVDLRFQDDTPYGVLIHSWVVPSTPSREGEVHVELWSTRYWDVETSTSRRYHRTAPAVRHRRGRDCVPVTGHGGFDVDVTRELSLHGSGTLDHTETLHTTYAPSERVVCG